jgi:hypothetical protein
VKGGGGGGRAKRGRAGGGATRRGGGPEAAARVEAQGLGWDGGRRLGRTGGTCRHAEEAATVRKCQACALSFH